MNAKLILAKVLLVAGAAMLFFAPASASAHDNIGGDELAVANWMLVGALVTVVLGVLAGLWAWKSGQFTNVEESKYTMLQLADDYDAIVAQAEREEIASKTPTVRPQSLAGGADNR